jgi:hypothetical protein
MVALLRSLQYRVWSRSDVSRAHARTPSETQATKQQCFDARHRAAANSNRSPLRRIVTLTICLPAIHRGRDPIAPELCITTSRKKSIWPAPTVIGRNAQICMPLINGRACVSNAALYHPHSPGRSVTSERLCTHTSLERNGPNSSALRVTDKGSRPHDKILLSRPCLCSHSSNAFYSRHAASSQRPCGLRRYVQLAGLASIPPYTF